MPGGAYERVGGLPVGPLESPSGRLPPVEGESPRYDAGGRSASHFNTVTLLFDLVHSYIINVHYGHRCILPHRVLFTVFFGLERRSHAEDGARRPVREGYLFILCVSCHTRRRAERCSLSAPLREIVWSESPGQEVETKANMSRC